MSMMRMKSQWVTNSFHKKFSSSLKIPGHNGPVYSITEDNDFIYSASSDKFVARWSKKTGVQDKFLIKLPSAPFAICLIDDNSKLVVGLESGILILFDIEKKIEIAQWRDHNYSIFFICENKLTHQFYSSDGNGNVNVWDTASLKLLLNIPTNAGKIRRIVLTKDSSSMVLCCQDGTLKLLDTIYFNEITVFGNHALGATSFCELSDDIFVSGGKDAQLVLWNAKTLESSFMFPAHRYVIYDILSLLDGQILVTASRDKSIKIWDTKTWELIQKIETKQGGHRFSVNALMKQNEHSFVSCSDDNSIICWSC